MKHFLLIALASLTLVSGCNKKQNKQERLQEQNDETYTIEIFGTVKTDAQKNITIDFQASVESIHVIEGQSIEAGDTLITLNLESINALIQKIEHELIINRLELDRLEHEHDLSGKDINREYRTLKNSISVTEEELTQLTDDYNEKNQMLLKQDDPDIKKLFNDLEMAKQDLKNSQEELERKRSLFDSGAIPEQELIDLEFAIEQKKMAINGILLSIEGIMLAKERRVDQLRIQISQKKAQLDRLKNELRDLATPEITVIEIQRERVKSLEDELENLKVKLGRSYFKDNRITSDVNRGIVTEVSCFEGDVVNSGQKLISIIDLDSLKVEGDVPEEFIKDVELDEEVTIIPLAYPDRRYIGRVVHISSMAIVKKGETVVPILISLNNNDEWLLPNFNVDIEIEN